MRMTRDPRFYYHVTEKCGWKDRVRLFPRENSHPGVHCRCPEEPDIARICVSPSVEQCMVSVDVVDEQRVYVYRTARRLLASHPFNVCDSRLTGERWLLKPTVFVKVGYFNGEVLWRIRPEDDFNPGSTDLDDLQKQRQYLAFVRRNLHSIIVCDNENGGKSWLRVIE